MTESKTYSFSTTNEKLQEKLDEWQNDRMLSAMINKTLRTEFEGMGIKQ